MSPEVPAPVVFLAPVATVLVTDERHAVTDPDHDAVRGATKPESADAAVSETDPEPSTSTPLLTPRDGVPPVIETPAALRAAASALAEGTGPVAVDAERASGYRYGQQAYLVQLRREGGGTHLLDPKAVTDLTVLAEALEGTEWVLHAASQDLACLREIGLSPERLFDTELAGRLLGHARVGLSSLLEEVLGYSLAKEHSAADWSTRPLPSSWLNYAALDVELLVELRDALEIELREAGKLEWALEEFDAARDAPPPPPRVDPWRRTSGMHKVRRPRQLAVIRSMWMRRDEIARSRDTSPGRILADSAIVAAASSTANMPAGTAPGTLASMPAFSGRGARRHLREWQEAVAEALALPESELPRPNLAVEGPPPPRSWAERDPDAAARLSTARANLSAVAERHHLPVENLISPDLVRRLCWTLPVRRDEASVTAVLLAGGARNWQVALAVPVLLPALERVAADVITELDPVALDVARDTAPPVASDDDAMFR